MFLNGNLNSLISIHFIAWLQRIENLLNFNKIIKQYFILEKVFFKAAKTLSPICFYY